MKRALLAAALASFTALLLLSCLSAPDKFLLDSLDAETRSGALTDAGIEQYNLHLVQRSDYDSIASVRAFFTNALALDPSNERAQQYLAMVDKYRGSKLAANVENADKLLAKEKRTPEENLRLVLSVEAATRLDPSSEDARRLAKATAGIRAGTIQSLLAAEQATLAKITADTSEDGRDRLMIEAWRSINQAFTIDPKSAAVQKEQARMKAEVAAIGTRRLGAARKLIAAGKFTATRTAIATMTDLNGRSGGLLAANVRTATYELNYQWAKWLYDQKEYVTAAVRIDAALAARREAPAAALKKQITDARMKAEVGETFEAGLAQADRLIGQGELAAAWRRLDALAASTDDKTKIGSLDTRRQKVRGALKGLYDEGVAHYRDESFEEAIDALETVVQIDPGYEQAADYLEKARDKQQLVDQF